MMLMITVPLGVLTAVPQGNGYRCTGMSYMNFPKVLYLSR